MKCPKCNSSIRLKMTGAVCTNMKCNWYTHDVSKLKIINKEISEGNIARKFREAEIDAITQDYEDLCGYDY